MTQPYLPRCSGRTGAVGALGMPVSVVSATLVALAGRHARLSA